MSSKDSETQDSNSGTLYNDHTQTITGEYPLQDRRKSVAPELEESCTKVLPIHTGNSFCVMPFHAVVIENSGLNYELEAVHDIYGHSVYKPCKYIIPNKGYSCYRPWEVFEGSVPHPFHEIQHSLADHKDVMGCNGCYNKESQRIESPRQIFNREIGYTSTHEVKYLVVELSNMCNFKCRMCDAEHSTALYEEHRALTNHEIKFSNKMVDTVGSFWYDWLEKQDSLQHVVFSGGEPFLDPRFYKTLKIITDKNFRIKVTVITNMSTISSKILPLLQMVHELEIVMSCDGSGKVGEYLRDGMSWFDLQANYIFLKDNLPRATFRIHYVLSAINVFSCYDHWVDFRGAFDEETFQNLDIEILDHPEHMQLKALIGEPKQAAISYLRSKIRDSALSNKTKVDMKIYGALFKAVTLLTSSNENSAEVQKMNANLYEKFGVVDRLRGQSLFAVVPELLPL